MCSIVVHMEMGPGTRAIKLESLKRSNSCFMKHCETQANRYFRHRALTKWYKREGEASLVLRFSLPLSINGGSLSLSVGIAVVFLRQSLEDE